MEKEFWEELQAQVESHGAEAVTFVLETDDGSGHLSVIDVVFDDDAVVVKLA